MKPRSSQGSLGMLPSASLGRKRPPSTARSASTSRATAAPRTSPGTGKANPLPTILSGALLLRYSLGAEEAARGIEAAVAHILMSGYRTSDILENGDGMNHVNCRQMGDLVAGAVMQGMDPRD